MRKTRRVCENTMREISALLSFIDLLTVCVWTSWRRVLLLDSQWHEESCTCSAQTLVHTEHSCSVWATVILSGWNGVQRLHSCSLCCSVTDGAISLLAIVLLIWSEDTDRQRHADTDVRRREDTHTHTHKGTLTPTSTFPLHPALPAVGVGGRTELVAIMWTAASGPVTGVRKQPGCLQQSREKSWP